MLNAAGSQPVPARVRACSSGGTWLPAKILTLRRSAQVSGNGRQARVPAVCYASRPAEAARPDAAAQHRPTSGQQPAQPVAGPRQDDESPEAARQTGPQGSRSWDDGDHRGGQQWSRPAFRDAFSRPNQPARSGSTLQRPEDSGPRSDTSSGLPSPGRQAGDAAEPSSGDVGITGSGSNGSPGPTSFGAQVCGRRSIHAAAVQKSMWGCGSNTVRNSGGAQPLSSHPRTFKSCWVPRRRGCWARERGPPRTRQSSGGRAI